jgi:hypothetical protein
MSRGGCQHRLGHEFPTQIGERSEYAAGDDIALYTGDLDYGEPEFELIELGRVEGVK